jgi:xanthosine utilization system XapX-like protein
MTAIHDNSQHGKAFAALGTLIWLALPLMIGIYAHAWNQLPARLATHFDFSGHPNGWMSRDGCLVFFVVFGTLMAVTATWVLSRVRRPDPPAWALVALFYILFGVLVAGEHAIIAFNVEGRPVDVMPVFATGMIAAAIVMVIALGVRRGPRLPSKAVLADEIHSSATWAALMGILTMLCASLLAKAANPGLRVVIAMTFAIMLGATAMAWSGFHYLFTRAGVEIRMMGFRLRSIAATDIQSYAVDHWNWSKGYGIRGVGDVRAYVWTNRGVRIQTNTGEVFLGHSDPKRIVRDLDKIVRNEGPEATRI